MPIPDFQSVMLPVLRLAADCDDHTLAEAVEVVATAFKVTDQERNELLPSGRQRRLHNRVGWAKTYLQKAGLVASHGRGKLRITDRGVELLRTKPSAIDMKLLEQFPEYVAFRDAHLDESKTTTVAPVAESYETPEELLEGSYQELRRRLSEELLERIKGCSPQFFERLVVDLLVAMGYGGSRKDAGQAIGQSGDEGIDGIIKEDRRPGRRAL